MQMNDQLLAACRRLAARGILRSPEDSFSLRIPGEEELLLASRLRDWSEVHRDDLRRQSFEESDWPIELHASIYRQRKDVGAVVVSSPRGVRLLTALGGVLPTLFDEQARHLGVSTTPILEPTNASKDRLRETFRHGDNAVLLGNQLLCLGMSCERVLFNTELYEKCAKSYVIAKSTGRRIYTIPIFVQIVAKRRLLKDERKAAASFHKGQVPEPIKAY
jgi:ribulose-5-phosphate 4-epimerase/fuculose-1-phosphate aldolase